MVAEIIINTSVKTLNKIFDYEIPKDMKVEIGSRVFVPFGNLKTRLCPTGRHKAGWPFLFRFPVSWTRPNGITLQRSSHPARQPA